MKQSTYKYLASLALAGVLLGTSGCATVKMWNWAIEGDDGSYSPGTFSAASPSSTSYTTGYSTGSYSGSSGAISCSPGGGGGMRSVVVWLTPVTLAFDAATLPIQIWKGYGPFKRRENN